MPRRGAEADDRAVARCHANRRPSEAGRRIQTHRMKETTVRFDTTEIAHSIRDLGTRDGTRRRRLPRIRDLGALVPLLGLALALPTGTLAADPCADRTHQAVAGQYT